MRIDSDLTFFFEEPPAEGLAGRSISGTVRADGSHIEVLIDDVPEVSVRRMAPQLRTVAAGLAKRGLTLSVRGPDGVLFTLGAVRTRLTDRLFARSRHIRLQNLRKMLRLARQKPRPTTRLQLPDLTPPPTVLPLAPTFRRLPRRVTTTHDPLGGGSPRLLFAEDSRLGLPTRVFYLKKGTTTIGGSSDSDLMLDGLDDLQAEIRRNDDDEYVVVASSGPGVTRVNGRTVIEPQLLRTGSRLQMGRWTMSYFRSEDADHGRPYGGRIGGELGHQRPQPTPTYQPADPD
jgi:hypothetical protein